MKTNRRKFFASLAGVPLLGYAIGLKNQEVPNKGLPTPEHKTCDVDCDVWICYNQTNDLTTAHNSC